MFEIMELHDEIMRNRIEAGLEKEDSIIPRTARLQRLNEQLDEDIEYFVKNGFDNPYYIATELGRHPETIKARLGSVIRKLESEDVSDIDILTGSWRSQSGCLVIFS